MQSRAADVPRTRDASELDELRQSRTSAESEEAETPANRSDDRAVAAQVNAVLAADSGRPLDAATRDYFEPRFGHDFSRVRVHTGATASESARSLNALAYTAGADIVFRDGRYEPEAGAGKGLLAHELTHVVQQRAQSTVVPGRVETAPVHIQRQMGEVRLAEAREERRLRLKLDYAKAKKANLAYAKDGSLGWDAKFATAAGGMYKGWADLWSTGQHDAFADAIAGFQVDQNFPDKDIDGVLGPRTWYRIAGLGEAMAGIKDVTWPESEYVCTIATEERIKRGHKLATGKALELTEGKTEDLFNAILQSIPGRMLDVDEQYRGTGPAGALVYAGLATFVPEAELWTGGLLPGAVIQVWGSREAYNLLRAGNIKEGGKTRRITDVDADFYGTSFVFVRVDPANSNRMLVRHYGSTEWKDAGDYEVWVAANALRGDGSTANAPAP